MKIFIIAGLMIFIAACSQQTGDTVKLQNKVDSLQHKLDNIYAPGLGEFMSGIQVHHAKLWFAGKAENWQLADFEINEIQESLEDIQKYCTDRPEVKSLPMIRPAIDSIKKAINAKSLQEFNSSFMILTSTCNKCHVATHHEFNVIKVPDNIPFTNQVFAKDKKS